jgi:tetratricopeptide (TPR) repeat protein
LIAKGEILNLQHKAAEAVPVLETAVRSNPEEPQAHFQLGIAYEMTANLLGAQKELREAVRRQPWMLNAQQALAELALRNGDTDLLDESAAAWLKFSPSAPQGYLYHGIALAQKGDVSAAETHLYKAIQMDPKFAAAYSRLGDLRVSQTRLAEAEKLYEQALALDPQEVNALQNLANVYLAQKKPEKAMQRAEIQAAKVPESSAYQMLLGQTLLSNHKGAEAETALKKSVELDKSNLAALILLAQVQEQNGHLDDAAGTYETAVRTNPQNAAVYTAFGAFEEHRGAWQKAEQLYQKALDFQADQATAANNLSYLMLEHGGDVDTALSLAQVARRGMPNSPNAADTLAWAYYQKGIYDSAIELLQDAIKKVPENATYRYHLGSAYQRVSKVSLARQNFQQALLIDPRSKRADEIRHALADLSSN